MIYYIYFCFRFFVVGKDLYYELIKGFVNFVFEFFEEN